MSNCLSTLGDKPLVITESFGDVVVRIAAIVVIGLLLGASHGCPTISDSDPMPHTIATEMEIDDELVHFTVIMNKSQTTSQELTHTFEVWLIAPGDVCNLGDVLGGSVGETQLTVRFSKDRLRRSEVGGNRPHLLVKHAAYERERGAPIMEFGGRVAYGEERIFLDAEIFD